MQVEHDLTDDELLYQMPLSPLSQQLMYTAHEVEEVVVAPSLHDMKQQLKGFAVAASDNSHFSAEDENTLKRFSDKVAKVLVSRVSQQIHMYITSRAPLLKADAF